MRVDVVCRNHRDDRVLPRFARYLAAGLGWRLVAAHDATRNVDALYLSAYFEAQLVKQWPAVPVAAYFTHREEEPPGNGKARLFDSVAGRVQLRVAMCRLYGEPLSDYGPTVQPPLPVERERFVPGPLRRHRGRMVAGFSGWTYVNKRKGEDLVDAVLDSREGRSVEWRASGRGWPVPTKRYTWKEMPGFYQSLDVLVCTSRVEGGPMPVLEALSCGVSVVIPHGVGILDELPEVLGIHRYKRGNSESLERAFSEAVEARGDVRREALRAVTEPYTIRAFCRAHEEAVMQMVEGPDGGMAEGGAEKRESQNERMKESRMGEAEEGPEPMAHNTGSTRGIYCVAFGDPARTVALRMMESAKKHMPEIPIALCAAKAIGPEDVLIIEKDSDIGGRRAKLKAYQLAPAEWESVLYLDADTVVVGDIRFYFELIEDGWEFVICKDPHLVDTLHAFRHIFAGAARNQLELEETRGQVHTLHTLVYNGGVWAFGRNKRIARFFARWQAEWEKHAQRDQPGLIRAMYTEPLRVYLLGNEWNTFPKYSKGIKTAGLLHYPGDARRWEGRIEGRIDSQGAWDAVKRFETKRKGKRSR